MIVRGAVFVLVEAGRWRSRWMLNTDAGGTMMRAGGVRRAVVGLINPGALDLAVQPWNELQ